MSSSDETTPNPEQVLRVKLARPFAPGDVFLREIIVRAPNAQDMAEVGSLDLGLTIRHPDGSLTRELDRALAMRWLERLSGINEETLGKLPLEEAPKLILAVARQLVWAAQNVAKKD